MSSKERKFSPISADIILKSAPKFRIYSMFLIHPELSLNQLSKLLNKAKSTIHEHLSGLIESGLISVVRKEKIRSNREKLFYGLTQETLEGQNFEESDLAPLTGTLKEKEYYCREVLKVYRSFTIQQISLLNNWKEYLDAIHNLINEGEIEEAYQSLSSVKNPENLDWIKEKKAQNQFYNYASLLSVDFYSPEFALEFVKSAEKIHNNLQYKEFQKIKRNASHRRVERTVYGGISVIPIKMVFDFLNWKKKRKERSPKHV